MDSPSKLRIVPRDLSERISKEIVYDESGFPIVVVEDRKTVFLSE